MKNEWVQSGNEKRVRPMSGNTIKKLNSRSTNGIACDGEWIRARRNCCETKDGRWIYQRWSDGFPKTKRTCINSTKKSIKCICPTMLFVQCHVTWFTCPTSLVSCFHFLNQPNVSCNMYMKSENCRCRDPPNRLITSFILTYERNDRSKKKT